MKNVALAAALFWPLVQPSVPPVKVMSPPPVVRKVVQEPPRFLDGWRPRIDALDTGPTIAQRVAACESGGDLRAQNPVSSASGLYQFVDSTWTWISGLPAPAKAYSEPVQTEMFWRLWDGGRGASHWEPSRGCWGQGEQVS